MCARPGAARPSPRSPSPISRSGWTTSWARTRRPVSTQRAIEWPAPALLGGVTALSAAVWNELYETRGSEVGGAGTVADLYLFDLAGIALFSFDAIPRFLARKLYANVWVGQASLLLPSGEIVNNSNLMYWKVPWKLVPSSSVFLWAGIGSMAGLTWHRPQGLDISVGLGVDTEQRVAVVTALAGR